MLVNTCCAVYIESCCFSPKLSAPPQRSLQKSACKRWNETDCHKCVGVTDRQSEISSWVFWLRIQNAGRVFRVDDVIVHMARESDSSVTSTAQQPLTQRQRRTTLFLIVWKEALCIYSKAINSLLCASYFISFIFGAARHSLLSINHCLGL